MLSAFGLGNNAIAPIFSAMAQTVVLKHFDTVNAFEEAFFGEEIVVIADQDQIQKISDL